MTLLFDIYPAIGHLNASFALANQWRERQHRVVYCAVEAGHKKRIEDNGFECVMLDYLLDSDKQELRVKGLRFILECVNTRKGTGFFPESGRLGKKDCGAVSRSCLFGCPMRLAHGLVS